ncbi:MAG TPA: nicotinate-nucleotide adenylyltransferase [Thermomicrobiales bacterium]|nr:nicotinate-nucleotide adenylyltransferase [Thermomicrobiales bacterium]
MARIGLLGGTFDPIHYGHLIIAEATRDQLGLDHIEFLPANDPPHKPDATVSPVHDRIAMVNAAIGTIPYFVINCIEMERVGPSYTVDTLERLKERRPEDDFSFIIGGDSLRDLPTWRSPARIIELASLAVINRPGARYDFEHLEMILPGLRARTAFIEAPLIDISATTLRTRCAEGRSIRFQTPDPVIEYITSNTLYR